MSVQEATTLQRRGPVTTVRRGSDWSPITSNHKAPGTNHHHHHHQLARRQSSNDSVGSSSQATPEHYDLLRKVRADHERGADLSRSRSRTSFPSFLSWPSHPADYHDARIALTKRAFQRWSSCGRLCSRFLHSFFTLIYPT